MFPANLNRRFNWVKFGKKNKYGKLVGEPVLSEDKARESDIMRHTFISNLSRIEPIGEVCYQCATSLSMIRRHYKVLIPDEKKVKAFFNIRPKDFGLS